jgi:hypothetical protein
MTPDANVNMSSPLTSAAPSASDPTVAAGVASTHGKAPVSGATPIKTLADFKRLAPKLYGPMMYSIADTMRREMQRHQDRLKKITRGQE